MRVWIVGTAIVTIAVAALVLLVMWLQRCPRCKSLRGPRGIRGWLLPGGVYAVTRTCRKCGHSWNESFKYDDIG